MAWSKYGELHGGDLVRADDSFDIGVEFGLVVAATLLKPLLSIHVF